MRYKHNSPVLRTGTVNGSCTGLLKMPRADWRALASVAGKDLNLRTFVLCAEYAMVT